MLLVPLLGLTGCGSYNRLVTLEQNVNKKWADVQSVYQRRADLIPNLVNTVAGVASFEDIDTAVEKGLRWPLGPFRLGDLTGLDVTYSARRHMYESTGDERYRPSPSLEAKVSRGELGRKTGRGWYRYPAEGEES